MGKRVIAGIDLIFCIMLGLIMPVLPVFADGNNTGLEISPVRQEVTVDAGQSQRDSLTVSDRTNSPMRVNFSVKQFSAANFTYDYVFQPMTNDWLRLGMTQVELMPGESKQVSYSLDVPKTAKPGGNYYMIFASTDIIGPGLSTTLQTTLSVYLTVAGNLIRTGSIDNPSVPWLVTGNDIPYSFNARNTGNVYYSAYFYGQVDGLFDKQQAVGTAHVLMPQAARTLTGSIPAPIIPGVYKVTYGYKTDFGTAATKSAYILFVPPWSVAAVVFLLGVGMWLFQKKRRKGMANESK